MEILDKRAPTVEYVQHSQQQRRQLLHISHCDVILSYFWIDTPGQIEVFTWSASGAIVTESLASSFPTVLIYVIDTPRTTSPTTFMSNMLYACRYSFSTTTNACFSLPTSCSILYKTKLPFLIVFNKTDVVSHAFAEEWIRDYETFHVRNFLS